jgi:hypothetical protein
MSERQQTSLNDVLINNRFMDETINLLQKDPDYMDHGL